MGQMLNTYLHTAQEYYREDQLDVAMRVVQDAFENTGWPEGLWTEFLNRLNCEKDARDGATLHTVHPKLLIELDRDAPTSIYEDLKTIAMEAMNKVSQTLQTQFIRPVMISVFRPDAATQFIAGPYGYVSHKTEHDKVCLPWSILHTAPANLLRSLTHEMTHCATFELGGKISSWLDEGLATYLTRDLSYDNWPMVVEQAKEHDLAQIHHLNALLSSADERKDQPELVQVAYYLAGWLVHWWVEHLGMESLRDALVRMGRGESEEHAIHHAAKRSIGDIEHEWRETLLGLR